MAQPVWRTCVGCRRIREQGVLVRLTIDPRGGLVVNPRVPHGRGAYLCPSLPCFAMAWKRRAFSRVFQRDLSGLAEAEVRGRFEAELDRRGITAA